MTEQTFESPARSYGCTFGCGNPYDFVLVTVEDGSTEFLCTPCFVSLAADMLKAMTEPDSPDVAQASAWAHDNPVNQAPGPAARRRGHNAPATTTDPSIMEAFESVMTVDELPEEFR